MTAIERRILDAMTRLCDIPKRDAFMWMMRKKGYSPRAIGSALGISRHHVPNRVARCREALKRQGRMHIIMAALDDLEPICDEENHVFEMVHGMRTCCAFSPAYSPESA